MTKTETKSGKMPLHFSRKLLAIPYGLFLAMFVVIPLLIIIYYAFTDRNGNFTFENFSNYFGGEGGLSAFLQSSVCKTIGRSLVIAFSSTVLCLLLAYPVAYIIAKSKLKNKAAFLLLFIVPMWVNFVLRINALRELFIWLGIFNKSNGLDLFNTVIGMVYDFLPFMILPIYTTIIKIDKSYLEASRDLGATGAQTFLKITLPLSKAGIMSGVSMVFLPSMTNYVISNWLTNNKTAIIGTLIETSFHSSDWQNGSVLAIILLLLMFLVTWLTGGFKEDTQAQSRGTALW